MTTLENLWRDARQGARRLLRAPLFTTFAVISLGLGLGVTTSVYSVVESLVWAPAAMDDPDAVAVVARPNGSGSLGRAVLSLDDFETLRSGQSSFTTVAGSASVSHTVAGPAQSEVLRGEAIIGDYFSTIGLPPSAGRELQSADLTSDAAPVTVLHSRLASRWFGAAQEAVGSVVHIGGVAFTVVGVAADRFDGFGRPPGPSTAYWIPHRQVPVASHDRLPSRSSRSFFVFGRLRPGLSVAEAAVELDALAGRLDRTQPERMPEGFARAGSPWPRSWQAASVSEAFAIPGDQSAPIGVLAIGLVAMALLVACLNLANLTLARGIVRRQELAIRYSLGASRARLVREQAVESALIACGGGLVAFVVIRLFLLWLTVDLPLWNGEALHLAPRLSARALTVALTLALASLAVFGLAPAVRLTRRGVASHERTGVSIGIAPKRGPWQLIRWQVAAAVVLFLVASVTLRVTVTAARHDTGIALHELAIVTVQFDRSQIDDDFGWRESIETIVDSTRQVPGAAAVAAATGMPFGTSATPLARVTTADAPFQDGRSYPLARALISTPSIFQALGVPLVRGRGFDGRDASTGALPAVISQRLARAMFGTTDVEGRTLLVRLWDREPVLDAVIVGVARDTDVHSIRSRGLGLIYLPLDAAVSQSVTIVARTTEDVASVAGATAAAVRRAQPQLGILNAGPARWLLATNYVVLRFVAYLTTGLGVLALVLSMVGLFGVLSQFVVLRRREMGLRLALGATRGQVRRLALLQGTRPVATGLLLGILLGTLLRAGIRATIEPVAIIDWLALAVVPLPVLAAAALACLRPAVLASRVDPGAALRDG